METACLTPMCFPTELIRDVAENLDSLKDRRTLRSLALASRSFGVESQRILFRTMDDGWIRQQWDDAKVRLHTAFLEGILQSPVRLGSYVQSYSQYLASTSPLSRPLFGDKDLTPYKTLWALTQKALPFMHNLKHLALLRLFEEHPAALDLLPKCKFQLLSLTWPGSLDNAYIIASLLPAQPLLQHLEIRSSNSLFPDMLPDGVCPLLTSLAWGYNGLSRLSKSRSITAFRASCYYRSEMLHDLPSVSRLKYLSASFIPHRLIEDMSKAPFDVEVLELRTWNTEVRNTSCRIFGVYRMTHVEHSKIIDFLQYLPNLTVLALFYDPGHPTARNTSKDRQMALSIFGHCLKLQYIAFYNVADPGFSLRYSRPKAALESGFDDGVSGDLLLEMYSLEALMGIVWWQVYLPLLRSL